MPSPAPSPFSPEVMQAVVGHMNGDHPDDNALIARSLGGLPGATSARMVGYDDQGARFEADVDGVPVETTVAWSVPITERATLRHEMVRMYHEACTLLGLTPRAAGEH